MQCCQGCSLVLNVSVSRQSRDVVSKRLGLVEMWEDLGLDLVSDWKWNVSVSYHRVSFTSQYAQLFASLQNCTYIVFSNVNSRSRLLYAVARPSVICLCETLMHPTQAVEIFGNVSTPFDTFAIRWHSRKISSHGNPSVGGVKHKRGRQI